MKSVAITFLVVIINFSAMFVYFKHGADMLMDYFNEIFIAFGIPVSFGILTGLIGIMFIGNFKKDFKRYWWLTLVGGLASWSSLSFWMIIPLIL